MESGILLDWSFSTIHSENDLQIIIVNKEPIFFKTRDDIYFPTLRVLHKCMPLYASRNLLEIDPGFMKRVQVDKGAIKFVMSGANIMCPGLTSPGGYLPNENLEKGEPVVCFSNARISC